MMTLTEPRSKDQELDLLLGKAIKNKRTLMGLSQQDFSAKAGLHRTYVSDVERGARNPSLHTLRRLAEALDTSLSGLINEAEILEQHENGQGQ